MYNHNELYLDKEVLSTTVSYCIVCAYVLEDNPRALAHIRTNKFDVERWNVTQKYNK